MFELNIRGSFPFWIRLFILIPMWLTLPSRQWEPVTGAAVWVCVQYFFLDRLSIFENLFFEFFHLSFSDKVSISLGFSKN